MRTERGLIALNAALVLVLLVVTLSPGASAQERRQRPRGQYTMVDGRSNGVTESIIYVVDAANQEMVALRWDNGQTRIVPLDYADLGAEAQRRGTGGR
ncbi:MAG: hypothetical protein SFZ24_05980 [Planctomycetota bacterium]|nr:hypothetical protein [Planctomycetota bacterium]